MDEQKKQPIRKEWEPMKVTRAGRVDEIIKQGEGKLSITGGDPGENRKNRSGLGERT